MSIYLRIIAKHNLRFIQSANVARFAVQTEFSIASTLKDASITYWSNLSPRLPAQGFVCSCSFMVCLLLLLDAKTPPFSEGLSPTENAENAIYICVLSVWGPIAEMKFNVNRTHTNKRSIEINSKLVGKLRSHWVSEVGAMFNFPHQPAID